jgi:hypothetical protein
MDDFAYVFGTDGNNEDSVLVGRGTSMDRIPAYHWRSHVAAATERISARLAFMSEEHHQVRRFAVREIAWKARPITEAEICSGLKLPRDRVHQILDELESRLFFLVRNSRGAVSWAYPFTADETPHRVVRPSRRPAWAA